MTKTQEQKVVKVKVRLLKEHYHAGRRCKPPDVIWLKPRQARHLIDDLKAAEPAPQEG